MKKAKKNIILNNKDKSYDELFKLIQDDEEATKLAVTNMANILNIQKREEAKSNPPKTSGGSDGGSKRGKDKFASAKITNF